MNSQAFEILEFGSLRDLVARHSQTEIGAARIRQLEPVDDFEALQRELRATREMIVLRQRGVRLVFEDVSDPGESLSRLKIEGTALQPLAILELARLCDRAMDAREAINAERDTSPTLFDVVSALPRDLPKLTALLRKKILPSGELDDRASPELAGVRREITNARSRITRTLENLMRRSSEAVQEELVTIRNERFVIPLRADHQSRIKGVTHGSSSSGATVFVEPLETIEANNELQSLREAEQREIAEILFGLSQQIRQNLPGIEHAADAVTELDFINAKAAFAEKFNCVVPEVPQTLVRAEGSQTEVGATVGAALEFVGARHPLLEESLRHSEARVVPVSFKLDNEKPAMVISGANAGGKTVILKTTGLLSLMALSGLPVPAKAARVPFYRSILADIGDHQSLAANLSTFTSHVANIASMIELCESSGAAAGSADIQIASSLVLLDEVGTGTDPEEGSALGVAVVDNFKQRGANVLATTHYSGLKMYAANEPGVLNASVEFDERTLQPTYRLLVGVAGSSSGLEIAQRFGIPSQIIARAGEQLRKSSREAIDYLRRIKHEAEEAESLRQALEEERAAVAEKFARLEHQFQNREGVRQTEFEKQLAAVTSDFERRSQELIEKILDRAERVKIEREAQKRAAELKREAQHASQAAKHRGEFGTADFRPSSETEGVVPHLRGVRVVRDGQVIASGRQPQTTITEAPDEGSTITAAEHGLASSTPSRDVRVGDRVRVRSFGSIGIVDRIKGDEAELRVGSLHMRESLENLELLDEVNARRREVRDARGSGRVKPSLEDMRRRNAATELHLHSKESDAKFQTTDELNLIGKTTDEAVELVDKFLDSAFLNGQREVRIIHGHGTGALRRAIAEMLEDHPHVARFTAAPQDQGGGGATVVALKS